MSKRNFSIKLLLSLFLCLAIPLAGCGKPSSDSVIFDSESSSDSMGEIPEPEPEPEPIQEPALPTTNPTYLLKIRVTNGSVNSTPPGINCGNDCSENYTEESSVRLTAIPASGYVLSSWGGDCSGSANPLTITMDQDRDCSVSFSSFKRLPDTGQTTSYAKGDDGYYNINPLSYTDNGLTITDHNTGLVWQKDGVSNCKSGSTSCNWSEAKARCDSLSLGIEDDWRLPNFRELLSIVNYGRASPAIDTTYFYETYASHYWTSTDYRGNRAWVWWINFSNGILGYYKTYKSRHFYVRCVRGEANLWVRPSLTDNKDGTVTDRNTGLIWQRNGFRKLGWWAALNYCEELELPADSGQTDWRLPNVRELHSIVDGSRTSPAVNKYVFHGTRSLEHWSSTTKSTLVKFAWYVYFHSGNVQAGYKNKSHYVRCVRGGR